MKIKKALLGLLLLLVIKLTSAQESTIKLNTIRDSAVMSTIAYAYPVFTNGKVFFTNNNVTDAKLNYDRSKDEILFIGNNDSLYILDNPTIIDKILIGNDTYYFISPGYAKLIKTSNEINLLQKSGIRLIGREKKGAYGTYSSTTSIGTSGALGVSDVINGILSRGSRNRIQADENLIFVASEKYYFINASKKYIPASSKSFLNLYPNHSKELKEYITTKRINFNKRADLEQLLTYSESLK